MATAGARIQEMASGVAVVGIAREGRSPENPSEAEHSTDTRVAVVPSDVRRLVDAGCSVLVERGAGSGLGYHADDFIAAGSEIVSTGEVFADSDLVLKLKGPSLDQIEMMHGGSTMGCFAHLDTFPERLKTFMRYGINVLALEDILDSPEYVPTETAFGRGLARELLPLLIRRSPGDLEVMLFGFSDELYAFAQQASRMLTRVAFLNPDAASDVLESSAEDRVIIYDSSLTPLTAEIASGIAASRMTAVDLASFPDQKRFALISQYLESNPPKDLGRRKIEFLHQTGECGVRYGLDLLEHKSPLRLSPSETNMIVFGYGNVAKGAISEALSRGVGKIQVLGRGQIDGETIVPYLESAQLIINGIDLGDEKGKTFLVTREHIRNDLIAEGSVIIDLVGGSKWERSAIENILTCTFLNDPHFVEHGVYFAALWGWPMMYMMRESCENYSAQITELLLGEERLIEGFDHVSPGVEHALVRAPVGPYDFERPNLPGDRMI